MAISAGETGSVGIVRDGLVFLYESPSRRHTTESEFDVSGLDTLPKVTILYFAVDADPELLRYAAAHSDGLVIAGAGAGEFSRREQSFSPEGGCSAAACADGRRKCGKAGTTVPAILI